MFMPRSHPRCRRNRRSAPEHGLTLTRVPVHLPARRASLARVMRLDLLHPARALSSSWRTSSPHPDRKIPRFSPAFARTFRPGFSRRAFRGPGHVPDLQVFDPDHVEPPRDVRAGLLRPVLTPVRLAGPQPGDRVPDPAAAVRAALRAGQRALQPPQPVRSRAVRPGQRSSSPVDSAAETATPRSMPTTWPLPGAGTGSGIAAKATCQRPGAVHGHPVGLRARRHRAGPAEAHPPGLGHPDLAGLAGQRRTSHCRPRRPVIRNPSSRPALRHDGRPAGLPESKNAAMPGEVRSACC